MSISSLLPNLCERIFGSQSIIASILPNPAHRIGLLLPAKPSFVLGSLGFLMLFSFLYCFYKFTIKFSPLLLYHRNLGSALCLEGYQADGLALTVLLCFS
jgi:hypothetical protein